jgi:hypothetical protein
VALSTLEQIFAVPDDADGAGVATVVDGASLLSHMKLDNVEHNSSVKLATICGTPRGRTAVLQVSTRGELRPSGGLHVENVGPFRARTYAAAVVGGPTDADDAAASRDRLVAGLTDALRRCVLGKSEGEAFFLAVLSVLAKKGLLERAHDNGGALLDAITEVDDGRFPRHVTLTNGIDVLHFARGVPSAIVTVLGLGDDVAGAVSPTLADSSTARERNRRYVGTFCAGALSLPLRADTAMPKGCTLRVLPDGGAALVGRDMQARLL